MIKQANIQFQSNLYESKNPTRRWIHQIRRDWVLGKLNSFSSKDASVLEVGTGCGVYTKDLVDLYGHVKTIDFNPDFVLASKTGSPSAHSEFANIETFHDGQLYDVILMTEVLEHVGNTKLSLVNVAAHLKKGGNFILTTPNKFSTTEIVARLLKIPLFAAVARKIYGEPVDDLGHVNLRTRAELMKELKSAGFTVESRTDLAFYLPVVAEFGGELGKRLLQWAERQYSKSSFFSHLLWTQCYVVTR